MSTLKTALSAGAEALHRAGCGGCMPGDLCSGKPSRAEVDTARIVLTAGEPLIREDELKHMASGAGGRK